MYRNLFIIALGCAALLGVFFLTFTGVARPRADFVFNNGTEPQTLDPGRMSGQPEGALAIGLFEGLTSYHPETLEPLPAVATHWDVEGLKYTFHLRPDSWWVQKAQIFAPGGIRRNVTAADFVYGWRRQLHPETGSEYSFILHHIVGVEEYERQVAQHWTKLVAEHVRKNPDAMVLGPDSLSADDREATLRFRDETWAKLVAVKSPDPRTLELTLKSPTSYFLLLTSFYVLAPIAEEPIMQHGHDWTRPENIVTNGPYMLEDWRFNSFVRLQKNPWYWETPKYVAERLEALRKKNTLTPTEQSETELLKRLGGFNERGLTRIDALAVETQNTALNLYVNGECDRLRELPAEVVADLIAESQRPETPFHHLHHGPLESVYFYNVNLNLPVFRDNPELGRKLRRAMALAVDRKGLVDVVTRAGQKPQYRLVTPTIPGYSTQPLFGSGDYEADVREARALMAEIKAAGLDVPVFNILYNTHQLHEKIAAFIQNNWKQVLGMEVRLSNQEWGVMLDAKRSGKFDIVRAAWIGDYPDPNTYLDMYTTSNQNNDSKYTNPHYDRIIQQYCARILDALATEESRRAMLADIESWPAFADTIAKRKSANGQTLDKALRSAMDEYARIDPTATNARIAQALTVRLLLFEIAEEMLMRDMPVIPLYLYTTTQVWPPELEGFSLNAQDVHPLKWLRWKDGQRPSGARYQDFPRFEAR